MNKAYNVINSAASVVGLDMYCEGSRPVVYHIGYDVAGSWYEKFSGIYKETIAYLQGRRDLMEEELENGYNSYNSNDYT